MAQPKKSNKEWQGNEPILLKYFLANIEKGNLPSDDELEEIMGSMDKRFYVKVCSFITLHRQHRLSRACGRTYCS